MTKHARDDVLAVAFVASAMVVAWCLWVGASYQATLGTALFIAANEWLHKPRSSR